MKIALLGSIPKGDSARESWADWKREYKKIIKEHLDDVEFVHGDAISDSEGPELVVGHDLAMIKQADVCVVDAQAKIGAGTAQEVVIAKYFEKPVVIVIPKNTHHRKTDVTFNGVLVDDWIHPFLLVSSDFVADSIKIAVIWIRKNLVDSNGIAIKDMTVFDKSIEGYKTKYH